MAKQIGTRDAKVVARFYETVLAVSETQHTIGHWVSLRKLLRSVADILSANRMAIVIENPTDPSTAVLYASSDPYEQCPRYGAPGSLGFPPLPTPQPKGGPVLLTAKLLDAQGATLGHLLASFQGENVSLTQVQLVSHTGLIIASLLTAAINRRLERLRTQILLGDIDPFIGAALNPIHIRIREVCDALDYKHVQYWEVSDDGEYAYVPDEPNRYSIRKNDQAFVAQVWRAGKPAIRYGVDRTNARFPELVPENNHSWIGYPILRQGRVTCILSCLDRDPPTALLSALDLPIIGALASTVGVERELALQLQANLRNRQSQSHEISGHLQNVMNNLRVLQTVLDGREPPSYIALEKARPPVVIIRNIHSFLGLAIRSLNLEDFAKLDDYTLNPTLQDVYPCLAETVAMVRVLLTSEPVSYGIAYEQFRDVRKFDKSALQEVLVILLLNAAKYTRSSFPVRISHPAAGVLHVKNFGIGIPPGEEATVFDRARQGSNVTSDMALQCESRSGHKGLGLYIARKIMEKAGGTLTLVQAGKPATDHSLLNATLGQHSSGVQIESLYTSFEVRLKA
jgi:signal transduction histidine kinase